MLEAGTTASAASTHVAMPNLCILIYTYTLRNEETHRFHCAARNRLGFRTRCSDSHGVPATRWMAHDLFYHIVYLCIQVETLHARNGSRLRDAADIPDGSCSLWKEKTLTYVLRELWFEHPKLRRESERNTNYLLDDIDTRRQGDFIRREIAARETCSDFDDVRTSLCPYDVPFH